MGKFLINQATIFVSACTTTAAIITVLRLMGVMP